MPAPGRRRAAQPGAELLHPRRQELRPQLELPAADRLRAGPRGVHADHRQGGPRPVQEALTHGRPAADPGRARAAAVALAHLDRPLVPGRRHALQPRPAGTASSAAARTTTPSASSTWRRSGGASTSRSRLGVKEYYFTGGEPFLNRDMVAILELTLRYGPATVLTNGTVFKDEWLDRLRRAEDGVAVQPGVPRLDRRLHGRGRTTRSAATGTFERAMRGVRQLRGARLPADHHRGPHARRPGRRRAVRRLRRGCCGPAATTGRG